MSEWLDMIGRLAAVAPVVVVPFMLIFSRLSLLIFMLPGIGTRIIPVNVRVVVALAITLLLFPVIAPRLSATDLPLVALIVGEVFVGFALGFFIRVSIFVLSMAGAAIAQSLSLSQIFGAGISEESNTTVSTLLTMAGAVLFLTIGAHITMIEIFVRSYENLPPGFIFANDAVGLIARKALAVCGDGLAFALMLSAPFLLLNLAYNVLLGVLNRAMPQLMVTFVGMPAITLSGLVLLLVAVSGLLMRWRSELEATLLRILP
ncbi:flagellar biosynthetic protein FliR [Parvularcula sp. LCG005]|uniref:flagellar biosynthetic protein FliR n=1 Tax=Parvularcula sp. LCG005 TaxID=3078805 RepID=UPI0029437A5B|nr:flagellar biosynthetic protein FliR [Parvularcula sp. LCG005]WOI52941.1 flagellar biosynthetic protein FliR [Parvularcula sp. LCG005]